MVCTWYIHLHSTTPNGVVPDLIHPVKEFTIKISAISFVSRTTDLRDAFHSVLGSGIRIDAHISSPTTFTHQQWFSASQLVSVWSFLYAKSDHQLPNYQNTTHWVSWSNFTLNMNILTWKLHKQITVEFISLLNIWFFLLAKPLMPILPI